MSTSKNETKPCNTTDLYKLLHDHVHWIVYNLNTYFIDEPKELSRALRDEAVRQRQSFSMIKIAFQNAMRLAMPEK